MMVRLLGWRPLLDGIDSVWHLFGMSVFFVLLLDIVLKIAFVSADRSLIDAGDLGDVDLAAIATAYANAGWVGKFSQEYDTLRVRPAPYVYFMTAQQIGQYLNVDWDGLRLVRHHPPPGCSRPVRPLRARSAKNIVDVYAASPSSSNTPCMASRIAS